MASTVVELPEELSQQLDEIATRSGQTRAEIIQTVLYAFVAGQTKPSSDPELPRSIGMIDVPDVTSVNLEDWLKANWHPEDDRGGF